VHQKGLKKTGKEDSSSEGSVIPLPNVKVDKDVCEGAGVCVEVCPMNVYDMVNTKEGKKAEPVRAEDCILCLACVNACPTQAITVEE